jgi:hypothetical protein
LVFKCLVDKFCYVQIFRTDRDRKFPHKNSLWKYHMQAVKKYSKF